MSKKIYERLLPCGTNHSFSFADGERPWRQCGKSKGLNCTCRGLTKVERENPRQMWCEPQPKRRRQQRQQQQQLLLLLLLQLQQLQLQLLQLQLPLQLPLPLPQRQRQHDNTTTRQHDNTTTRQRQRQRQRRESEEQYGQHKSMRWRSTKRPPTMPQWQRKQQH